MPRKIIIASVVFAIAGGGGYLATRSAPLPAKHDDVYVLRKPFLLTLERGTMARITVAMTIPHERYEIVVSGGESEEAAPAGEDAGLPQEPVIRAIVVERLTGSSRRALLRQNSRHAIERELARQVRKSTDVPAAAVLMTDVTAE